MKSQMKVLIAYDGSQGAKAAIADLKRAGLTDDVTACVVSIADVFLPASGLVEASMPESVITSVSMSREIAASSVENAKEMSVEGAKMVRKLFPAWKIEAESFADSPAWGILKKAKNWRADLIVVGAHGLASTGRLLLGSISQKLVSEADCSVRVVREKPQELVSPPRIVVCVDGSPCADEMVLQIAARHWPQGTAAHVMMAIDSRVATSILASKSVLHQRLCEAGGSRYRYWVDSIVESAVEKMQEKGVSVTFLAKKGDPKKILLEEAEKWGADCIFAGARGLSGIKHFLIGSISASLAARAHCTVEIVRSRAFSKQEKTVMSVAQSKMVDPEISADTFD